MQHILLPLTLMLLVRYLGDTKLCEKPRKMTETLANGYSSESTPRELSNEYQHDRVWMIFKNLCVLVPWRKVASALEGLTKSKQIISETDTQFSLIGKFTRLLQRSQ